MNLNEVDFLLMSFFDLGKVASMLNESEDFTDESRKILERYIMRMLIAEMETLTRKNRLFLIKKMLYVLGTSYPEFLVLYARLDQEYDLIVNGD